MKDAIADSIYPPEVYPLTKAQDTKSVVSMTFRVIIPARIRRTDATNERFSERINRERFPRSSASMLRSSLSLADAQKAEPSTRGYLRDRLLYRHNPRGAYPGFLCLCIWSPLIFSLLDDTHPPLFHQSGDAQPHAHSRAWDSTESLSPRAFPLLVPGAPTKEGED